MTEELIQKWKEYKKAFDVWSEGVMLSGGSHNKKPDFSGFMFWLEHGYIQ